MTTEELLATEWDLESCQCVECHPDAVVTSDGFTSTRWLCFACFVWVTLVAGWLWGL